MRSAAFCKNSRSKATHWKPMPSPPSVLTGHSTSTLWLL
ncbi:MAG: DUF551 domain-containing protein (plasmid) [Leptolyngbya sp. BL-A-14]